MVERNSTPLSKIIPSTVDSRNPTPNSRSSLQKTASTQLRVDSSSLVSRSTERNASLIKADLIPNPRNQPLKFSADYDPNSVPEGLVSITIKVFTQLVMFIKDHFSSEVVFLQQHSKELDAIYNYSVPIAWPELRKYKYLMHFDSFLIYNKQIYPDYNAFHKVLSRYLELISVLEEMLHTLLKESSERKLVFFEESECYKCLQKIFSQSLFQKEMFLKTCSEIWRFIRKNNQIDQQDPLFSITVERIKLFLFGISIPSNNPLDYPFHKAIYESNVSMVRKLCEKNAQIFYSHIEEADPLGITPMALAVRLVRQDVVLILADHGANPKHRVFPAAKTPLEEAVNLKRKPIVRTLLIAQHHQVLLKWQENKNRVLSLFESMPDFQFQIDWECDSKFIPFVKSFTPNETYYLYKRGGHLRIDMNLVGWSKIQTLKGKVSVIINAKGSRDGEILVVDNITKTVSNLLTDVNLAQLDQEVEDLIAQEQHASEIKADNISLNIAKTWRGEPITQKIENYTGVKYNAKGTFHMMLCNSPWMNQFDSAKLTDFTRYFNFCKQNQVWLSENTLQDKGNYYQFVFIV